MGDGSKFGPIGGVIVAGIAAFIGGAFYVVSNALENPPALPMIADAPDWPKVGEFKPPVPAAAPPAAPAAPAEPDQFAKLLAEQNQPAAANPGWKTASIWGLPAPRKLTDKEKAALALLGTADEPKTYKFNTMTLEDGSRIPGTPALAAGEIKEHVIGPIKKLGLADGFEAAVIDLAPHNLNYLNVQVSNTPDWTEVQAILGKPDGRSEGDVYLKGPTGQDRTYFRVAWFQYGWLEFGVGEGKVRVIKADMFFAKIVPAESIPGGRSAPDPNKARSQRKFKPARLPTETAAEVDVLKLLGRAAEAKAIVRKSPKKDPQVEKLVQKAEELSGKEVYPGAVETARMLKQSFKIQSLDISPSLHPPIEEIAKLLGDPVRTKPDRAQATLTWHQYHWLEFGVENGKVLKVRIICLMIPSMGL